MLVGDLWTANRALIGPFLLSTRRSKFRSAKLAAGTPMIDEFAYPTTESRMIALQIGGVCVNWSAIDSTLGFILGKYMKVDEHIGVATGILDMNRKCELVKALSFIADDKQRHKRLVKVLNFLDGELRPIRNRYVHDNYSFFTGENIRKIFKAKIVKPQAFQMALITQEQVNVSADEIESFNNDLNACAMFLTYHLLGTIIKPEKAEPKAMEAFTAVGEDSYSKILSVMKRYATKPKAA